MGGALARPAAVPNAIGHRDAAYQLMLAALAPPEHRETAADLLRRSLDRIAPWDTGAVFPNFLGGSGHSDPAEVRTAYRPADYARLQQLKQVYDPRNLFRLNHNIPPAADTLSRAGSTQSW